MQAQEDKGWRVWVQDEDPFCFLSPQNIPLWSQQPPAPPGDPSGPSSREATPPPRRPSAPMISNRAFSGVVSDHRQPRKGLWATRQSVKSGNPGPSKDNPPPPHCPLEVWQLQPPPLIPVCYPGPDTPGGEGICKNYVTQKYAVFIYKVVLVNSSFILRGKKNGPNECLQAMRNSLMESFNM